MKLVGLMKLSCSLDVVTTVSDAASFKRKFVIMLKDLKTNAVDDSVVYKTTNIFRTDHEFLFFSDIPHLFKSCRNCLFNSGSGCSSRYLGNNGKHLLWQHIVDVYRYDLENGLHMLPKLSADHIFIFYS